MNNPTYEELKHLYMYLFQLLSENLDTTCIEDGEIERANDVYEHFYGQK